jgi:FLVCR family MFS transporter 7
MDDLSGQIGDQKNVTQREEEVPDTGGIPPAPLASSSLASTATTRGAEDELLGGNSASQFRVYKRRWFGLIQLILLNIVVSWDVSYAFCCLVLSWNASMENESANVQAK